MSGATVRDERYRGTSVPSARTSGARSLVRTLAALVIGAGMVMSVMAGATWPAAAGPQSAEPEPVIATMLSSEVSWRWEPTTAVRIELVEGDTVIAAANGVTGPNGWITATLLGGLDPLVRPGRVVRAGPVEGPAEVTSTVPELTVQLLQARYELAGDAPPGSRVRASISARGLITDATTTVMASGRYTLPLPSGFGVDEGADGFVELVAAQGRFRAAFEGLSAMADIGGALVWGRATRGGHLQARVSAPSSAISEEITVEGGPAYSVTLRQGDMPFGISPGDRLSMLEDGRTTVISEVPDIYLRADLTGAITGWSPPRSSVTIEAAGPGGQARTIAQAGVNGLFSAHLGDSLLFEPGTVVSATTGRQLRFRKSVTVRGATANLNDATVTGVTTPGLEARVSLLGLDGRPKASGRAEADEAGRFSVTLLDRNDQPAAALEGEEIVLGTGPSLPIRSTLPPLAAYASPLDDVVVGTTWPSLDLLVEGGDAKRHVVSDGEGVFVADFRPDFGAALDIGPGDIGRVTYVYPHLVVHGKWVAPVAELTLFESDVTAVGVPGLPLTITLRNGTSSVASAAGWTDTASGEVDSRMRAPDGQPVTSRDQDDLSFDAPRFHGAVKLPALEVAANPVAGSIAGVAPPGASVSLIRPDGTAMAGASADASGAFSSATGMAAIGETIGVEVVVGDLVRVRRFEPVRRAVVNMDTSHIAGWGVPNSPIQSELSRPGAPSGQAGATADDTGWYAMTLEGQGGGSVEVAPGSDLIIEDGGPSPVSAEAPLLELDLDEANLILVLTGPPGARVRTRFAASWGSRAGREVRVSGITDSAGRMRLGFPPGLAAADGISAQVELDHQGVTWTRSVGTTYTEAQVGGILVRGRQEPGAAVLLAARRGGSQIGTASARADARGAYTAMLQTAPGVRLEPGDELLVDGAAASVLRPLTLHLDQGAGRAEGSASPGDHVEFAFASAKGDALGRTLMAAAGSGEFSVAVSTPAPLAPGISAEAFVNGAAGARTFALDTVPRLVVRMGSSTVSGLAAPFGRVAVDVVGGGSAGTASAEADTLGRFRTVLGGAGGPVAIQPGAQVHYAPEGAPEVVLEVPAFGVRLLDKGLITGWAPPSAEVLVRLTGPGGTTLETSTRVFLDGTWVLRESEMAGAPPFPLTQTTGALAWIDVDGHRVEAHTGSPPAATSTPTIRPVPGSPTPTRTAGPTPTATATARTGPPTATRTATDARLGGASLFFPLVRAP